MLRPEGASIFRRRSSRPDAAFAGSYGSENLSPVPQKGLLQHYRPRTDTATGIVRDQIQRAASIAMPVVHCVYLKPRLQNRIKYSASQGSQTA
jgi:hypothetical protein